MSREQNISHTIACLATVWVVEALGAPIREGVSFHFN
jgi:hypothetical protein